MKFECFQENLSKGLAIVSKAVPTKGTLPVLSNVLIKAQGGVISLVVTNLETSITYTFGGVVEEEGSITVPAKLLNEFVSNLSPGKVFLATDRTFLNVVAIPKVKSRFNGMSAIEFPEIPTPKSKENLVELSPKLLSSLVSQTAFASSSDVTRPVLTGTLIDYTDGKFSLVCTDGFRLSEKVSNLENSYPKLRVIVPTKTLSDVAKIFHPLDSILTVIYNPEDNLVYFNSENILVGVRVIDGSFPDYKRIIPSTKSHTITLNTNELHEAIKLNNVFSRESASPIKLSLTDTGTLKVFSSSDSTGEHSSEFEVEVEGEPLTVSFNHKYLNDFLNNIKSDKLVLESGGGTSPVVFRLPEVNDFLHIIMPMKS